MEGIEAQRNKITALEKERFILIIRRDVETFPQEMAFNQGVPLYSGVIGKRGIQAEQWAKRGRRGRGRRVWKVEGRQVAGTYREVGPKG